MTKDKKRRKEKCLLRFWHFDENTGNIRESQGEIT